MARMIMRLGTLRAEKSVLACFAFPFNWRFILDVAVKAKNLLNVTLAIIEENI